MKNRQTEKTNNKNLTQSKKYKKNTQPKTIKKHDKNKNR